MFWVQIPKGRKIVLVGDYFFLSQRIQVAAVNFDAAPTHLSIRLRDICYKKMVQSLVPRWTSETTLSWAQIASQLVVIRGDQQKE